MLFSILIYVSEDAVRSLSQAEDDAHVAKHLKMHDKLAAEGRLGPVVRLMPTNTARHLRTAGSHPDVIDGPFAETKEQLLGFYVVECASEAEAMDIARSLPSLGTVFEIRPVKLFFPGNGLPQFDADRGAPKGV